MYRLCALVNGINGAAGSLEDERLIKIHGVSLQYSLGDYQEQRDTGKQGAGGNNCT